jgi:hypothetical protein
MLQRGRQPAIAGAPARTPVDASTHGTQYSPHPSRTVNTSLASDIRGDVSAPSLGRTVTCGLPPLITRGRGLEPQKAQSLRTDVNDAPNTQYRLRATATTSNRNYERLQLRATPLAINNGRPVVTRRVPAYRPQSHLPPRQINSQPRRANKPQAQSIDHSRDKVTWCARLRKLRGKLAAIHRMPSCGQFIRISVRP